MGHIDIIVIRMDLGMGCIGKKKKGPNRHCRIWFESHNGVSF